MRAEEVIERKRDGGRHAAAEIEWLVREFTAGRVPDYQMSAWLMAAFLKGLDADETVWLTRAMTDSGRRIDLSGVGGAAVDKHSTGGVADTTTLVVAPLAAACGVKVAKMSGRGLGHTGGTLDKLEAIPGFRTALTEDEFVAQVRDVGVAVAAQTDDIAPADKKMYALRDVTGTVPSAPLIVGSIVSKKAAGGAKAVLLDVKCGSGAFMKSEADARALAGELVRVGGALGVRMAAVVTDMDEPLGSAVGNALEVREAVRVLHGEGPERLTRLCVELAARLVTLGGLAGCLQPARDLVRDALGSGRALARFRAWVAAQGGDPRVADDPALLPVAPVTRTVPALAGGWVRRIDAEAIGRAAMLLGAGRETTDAVIDLGAGLELAVRVGSRVGAREPLATLHTSDQRRLAEAEAMLLDAVVIGPEAPAERPLLLEAPEE